MVGATVIPMNDPDLAMNFKQEALMCAINEACAGADTECSIVAPCLECQALGIIIEKVLIRAFIAGQASVMGRSVE